MAVDANDLVRFAQELVRIPSVFDPAHGLSEEPAAELVAEQMRTLGWTPRMELVAPGRPNVVAIVDGGRPGPTLCFEGHTDVVTAGSLSDWSVDPFGAEIRDGRLYGRGAADMKAGLAAMVFGTHALCQQGAFPGRVMLAALVDEEGMMSGAKHFVASGHADGIDGVICCEPEGGEVCHVAKGALRLRVALHGKMAHGAMPFQGRNPNRAAASLITALAGFEAELQAVHDEHPYLGRVWVTPTVLRAGEPAQMNVIPAESSVWIDVRTVPDVVHGELIAGIERLASEAAAVHGVTAAVEVIDDRPPVATDERHALVRAVRDAHAAVTGQPSRLGGVPGATDGTILSSRAGIASVVYGPGGKWIAHQADEYVDVDEIATYAEVYAQAARRFLEAGAVDPSRTSRRGR